MYESHLSSIIENRDVRRRFNARALVKRGRAYQRAAILEGVLHEPNETQLAQSDALRVLMQKSDEQKSHQVQSRIPTEHVTPGLAILNTPTPEGVVVVLDGAPFVICEEKLSAYSPYTYEIVYPLGVTTHNNTHVYRSPKGLSPIYIEADSTERVEMSPHVCAIEPDTQVVIERLRVRPDYIRQFGCRAAHCSETLGLNPSPELLDQELQRAQGSFASHDAQTRR